MANRHLSRSLVLQTLFEWDFNGNHNEAVNKILERNVAEFGPGLEDDAFIKTLTQAVVTKHTIIDDIIRKAAPEWPIEKIAVPDRNVLRIGLAELLFGDRTQVPPKVAINEAIELAKAFGGENSSRFVNGVLGAVYKELGEPGKDETSKKKPKFDEPIDPAKLPLEQSAGAIVYAVRDGVTYLAMVHDVFGYWSLAKGRLQPGESVEDCVARKVKAELGLIGELMGAAGENEYIANNPETGKYRKRVTYMLMKSEYHELTPDTSKGLDGAEWFSLEEIPELKIYDDILPILTKGIERIVTIKN